MNTQLEPTQEPAPSAPLPVSVRLIQEAKARHVAELALLRRVAFDEILRYMNLRQMRKKARISLKALAAEMGISPVMVEYIEKWPLASPELADRYVEALARLTA